MGDRIGPLAVVLQDFGETDDPGCELHVHVRDHWAAEEGALGVGHGDDLLDFVLEIGDVFELFRVLLLLQKAVEERDDFAVDLLMLVEAERTGFGNLHDQPTVYWSLVLEYREAKVCEGSDSLEQNLQAVEIVSIGRQNTA